MNKRGERLQEEIGAFVQQYARKSHKGYDPNDRRYDRKIEELIKRMDPRELDALLHEDLGDPGPEV